MTHEHESWLDYYGANRLLTKAITRLDASYFLQPDDFKDFNRAMERGWRRALIAGSVAGGGRLDPDDPLVRRFMERSGVLIRNINETTRDRVMRDVERAYREGRSKEWLAGRIASDPSGAFDPSRAMTIGRTESGWAHNYGMMSAYQRRGIRYVKIVDGPGCGWTSHNDGDVADGTLRLIEDFANHPLAHPNCVRHAIEPDLLFAGDAFRDYVRAWWQLQQALEAARSPGATDVDVAAARTAADNAYALRSMLADLSRQTFIESARRIVEGDMRHDQQLDALRQQALDAAGAREFDRYELLLRRIEELNRERALAKAARGRRDWWTLLRSVIDTPAGEDLGPIRIEGIEGNVTGWSRSRWAAESGLLPGTTMMRLGLAESAEFYSAVTFVNKVYPRWTDGPAEQRFQLTDVTQHAETGREPVIDGNGVLHLFTGNRADQIVRELARYIAAEQGLPLPRLRDALTRFYLDGPDWILGSDPDAAWLVDAMTAWNDAQPDAEAILADSLDPAPIVPEPIERLTVDDGAADERRMLARLRRLGLDPLSLTTIESDPRTYKAERIRSTLEAFSETVRIPGWRAFDRDMQPPRLRFLTGSPADGMQDFTPGRYESQVQLSRIATELDVARVLGRYVDQLLARTPYMLDRVDGVEVFGDAPGLTDGARPYYHAPEGTYDALVAAIEAMRSTEAFRSIEGLNLDPAYAAHLTDSSELFARGFAQWLAVTSGDRALLYALNDRLNAQAAADRPIPLYIPADQFEPVRQAFDALMDRLDMRRPEPVFGGLSAPRSLFLQLSTSLIHSEFPRYMAAERAMATVNKVLNPPEIPASMRTVRSAEDGISSVSEHGWHVSRLGNPEINHIDNVSGLMAFMHEAKLARLGMTPDQMDEMRSYIRRLVSTGRAVDPPGFFGDYMTIGQIDAIRDLALQVGSIDLREGSITIADAYRQAFDLVAARVMDLSGNDIDVRALNTSAPGSPFQVDHLSAESFGVADRYLTAFGFSEAGPVDTGPEVHIELPANMRRDSKPTTRPAQDTGIIEIAPERPGMDIPAGVLETLGRINDLIGVPESVAGQAEIELDIDFTMAAERGSAGEYNNATLITLAADTDPATYSGKSTFAHEVGHFIDRRILHDTPVYYWSDGNDGLAVELGMALDATETIQRLRDLVGSLDATSKTAVWIEGYLLDPTEMFARAFEQWYVLRSGDQDMMDWYTADMLLRSQAPDYVPQQWTWDDFEPIAEIMDRIFIERGMVDSLDAEPEISAPAAEPAPRLSIDRPPEARRLVRADPDARAFPLVTDLIRDDAQREVVETVKRALDSIISIDEPLYYPDVLVNQKDSLGLDMTGTYDESSNTIELSGKLFGGDSTGQVTLDLMHEVGHYLDHVIFGRGKALKGEFGSDTAANPLIRAVLDAMRNSPEFADLQDRLDQARELDIQDSVTYIRDYLMSPRELFARGFAQWAAERTGNLDLVAAVMARSGAQWDSANFGPIAEAFDRLFIESGMSKEAPRLSDSRLRDEFVVRTSDVEVAAKALANGQKVELESVRQVSTLLDRLAAEVQRMHELGEEAPDYNLCNVTVRGTNIFCVFNKGIPRVKMPQLSGFPRPHSLADMLPRTDEGGVDAAPQFIEHLRESGIDMTEEIFPAAFLKATQNELIGGKIAGMVASAARGDWDPTASEIWVSSDDYVIDGHHRWATVVGLDAMDGELGDVQMRIRRIDMPITQILPEVTRWAGEFGIAPVGTDEKPAASQTQPPDPGPRIAASDGQTFEATFGGYPGASPPAADRAATLVAGLISVPDGTPSLPIIYSPPSGPHRVSPDVEGAYWPNIAQAMLSPSFKWKGPDSPRAMIAAAHEIGHFIDHMVFGSRERVRSELPPTDGSYFGSGSNSETTRGVMDAIYQSEAWAALQRLPINPHNDYLRRPQETFARAFAQWVAWRSDDPDMRDGIEAIIAKGKETAREKGGEYIPVHWSAPDFRPIAEAFDRMFIEAGMSRQIPASLPHELAFKLAPDQPLPFVQPTRPEGEAPTSAPRPGEYTTPSLPEIEVRIERSPELIEKGRVDYIAEWKLARNPEDAQIIITGKGGEPVRIPAAEHAAQIVRDLVGNGNSREPLEIILNGSNASQSKAAGVYDQRLHTIDTDPAIDLSSGFGQVTLLHEIGHYVDHMVLGSGALGDRGFASEQAQQWMLPLFEAIEKSRGYAEVIAKRDSEDSELKRKWYDIYMLTKRELFARAFSQWAILRSGDQALAENFRTWYEAHRSAPDYLPMQWDADDFATIAAEMDRIFVNRNVSIEAGEFRPPRVDDLARDTTAVVENWIKQKQPGRRWPFQAAADKKIPAVLSDLVNSWSSRNRMLDQRTVSEGVEIGAFTEDFARRVQETDPARLLTILLDWQTGEVGVSKIAADADDTRDRHLGLRGDPYDAQRGPGDPTYWLRVRSSDLGPGAPTGDADMATTIGGLLSRVEGRIPTLANGRNRIDRASIPDEPSVLIGFKIDDLNGRVIRAADLADAARAMEYTARGMMSEANLDVLVRRVTQIVGPDADPDALNAAIETATKDRLDMAQALLAVSKSDVALARVLGYDFIERLASGSVTIVTGAHAIFGSHAFSEQSGGWIDMRSGERVDAVSQIVEPQATYLGYVMSRNRKPPPRTIESIFGLGTSEINRTIIEGMGKGTPDRPMDNAILAHAMRRAGTMDRPPLVTDRPTFDSFVEQGATRLYWGVPGDRVSATALWANLINGRGFISKDAWNLALGYMMSDSPAGPAEFGGAVGEFVLRPDARIVDIEDVRRMQQKWSREVENELARVATEMNENTAKRVDAQTDAERAEISQRARELKIEADRLRTRQEGIVNYLRHETAAALAMGFEVVRYSSGADTRYAVLDPAVLIAAPDLRATDTPGLKRQVIDTNSLDRAEAVASLSHERDGVGRSFDPIEQSDYELDSERAGRNPSPESMLYQRAAVPDFETVPLVIPDGEDLRERWTKRLRPERWAERAREAWPGFRDPILAAIMDEQGSLLPPMVVDDADIDRILAAYPGAVELFSMTRVNAADLIDGIERWIMSAFDRLTGTGGRMVNPSADPRYRLGSDMLDEVLVRLAGLDAGQRRAGGLSAYARQQIIRGIMHPSSRYIDIEEIEERMRRDWLAIEAAWDLCQGRHERGEISEDAFQACTNEAVRRSRAHALIAGTPARYATALGYDVLTSRSRGIMSILNPRKLILSASLRARVGKHGGSLDVTHRIGDLELYLRGWGTPRP